MPLRIFRQAAVLAVPVLAAGLLGPLPTPGWSASAPPDLALSWLRAGATAPFERATRAWLSALAPLPLVGAAEAASPSRAWPGVPPVPVSPYITTDTRPIGPGLRDEETRIWRALQAAGLSPFVVKVTVASDGVSRMPNGLIGHLAWIWFVYGMDWTGGAGSLIREVQASERALAVTADDRPVSGERSV